MKNVAYIYEPHFKTQMFRVAVSDQQADVCYIVVTCSPKFNGAYKYTNRHNYEIYMNGSRPCYCVPINECVKIQELKDFTKPDTIAMVKKQQEQWYKNQIKNRDYTYKEKPEWML